MKKKKYGILIIAAAFLLMIVYNGGCRAPLEEGVPPGGETPGIPEEIRGGDEEEPVLNVYMHETGEVQEMSMEEYIEGVVAAEMETDWPEEALAAQAIIARSFTLQKIDEDGGLPERNAHASTDIEEFQAYDAERVNENVRNAVDKTRGEVAVYNGEFIRAWFHAYAGPRTALADEGLDFEDNPPYIHIVESPAQDIIDPEEADWSADFPLDQVSSVVSEETGEDPGEITSAEVAEEGPSGRAALVSFNDTEIPANDLRMGLGSTEMRSTFIEEIQINNGNLEMSGTGYGHGVGMCQWGAKALAEEGDTAEDIVSYYFDDITVVSLWE